ncbi:MAG: hypothetical protein KGI27_13720 [Thaumarchaeota archaeon]|nr:hypothetical protein [Nitrososphaerota archaeon]
MDTFILTPKEKDEFLEKVIEAEMTSAAYYKAMEFYSKKLGVKWDPNTGDPTDDDLMEQVHDLAYSAVMDAVYKSD